MLLRFSLCVCVCVCVCACVRACVRACVCVRAYMEFAMDIVLVVGNAVQCAHPCKA